MSSEIRISIATLLPGTEILCAFRGWWAKPTLSNYQKITYQRSVGRLAKPSYLRARLPSRGRDCQRLATSLQRRNSLISKGLHRLTGSFWGEVAKSPCVASSPSLLRPALLTSPPAARSRLVTHTQLAVLSVFRPLGCQQLL